MKPLFSAEGRAALQALASRRPLLAFDFDGTLAPIVPRPETARVPLPVVGRLRRLAELATVAVVTGRDADDVRPRLGFEPKFTIGNHGIDIGTPEAQAAWRAALDPLRDEIAAQDAGLRHAGVTVEDKGLSLALHYRLAPHHDQAVGAVEAVLAVAAVGLRVVPGKCVLNVMDPRAPDKGDAMLALVERAGCDCALFVGDDENDESVFIKAPPDWVTVRVERDHIRSRARYYLDGTPQIPALLDALVGRICAT
jgi:trehalose 6-phosphate phosphatase